MTAVLVAFVLVAAACASGGDEASEASLGTGPGSVTGDTDGTGPEAGGPSTSAPTGSDPGPSDPGPAPAATRPDGTRPDGTQPAGTQPAGTRPGVTTTSPPGSTDQGPGARPAVPGSYVYSNRGQVDVGLGPAPLSERVVLVVESPVGTSQRGVRTMTGPGGLSLRTETVLDLRADGVYLVLLRQVVTAVVLTQTEELRPPSPVLLFATAERAGASRTLVVPTSTGSARLTVTVVGDEVVTVGGTEVTTRVVDIEAVLDGAQPGTIDQRLWVVPERGLVVREVAAITAGGGRIDYDLSLTSLDPS